VARSVVERGSVTRGRVGIAFGVRRLAFGVHARASSFARRPVVERASLARPTLSGVRHRAAATEDKLCSCSTVVACRKGVSTPIRSAFPGLHPRSGLKDAHKEPGVACPSPGGSQTSPRRLKLPTSPHRYNSGAYVGQAGRLRRASRFTMWQLYRLAAGGSRERLRAMFCPSRLFCCRDTTAHRTAARRDVPGSRLLATDRATTL
jgi:hypothetical protein